MGRRVMFLALVLGLVLVSVLAIEDRVSAPRFETDSLSGTPERIVRLGFPQDGENKRGRIDTVEGTLLHFHVGLAEFPPPVRMSWEFDGLGRKIFREVEAGGNLGCVTLQAPLIPEGRRSCDVRVFLALSIGHRHDHYRNYELIVHPRYDVVPHPGKSVEIEGERPGRLVAVATGPAPLAAPASGTDRRKPRITFTGPAHVDASRVMSAFSAWGLDSASTSVSISISVPDGETRWLYESENYNRSAGDIVEWTPDGESRVVGGVVVDEPYPARLVMDSPYESKK